jgi:hypothetical protein
MGDKLVQPCVPSIVLPIYYIKTNKKEQQTMKIEERSELLVIDIPQKDFKEMAEDNMDSPMWDWIRNTKRVLDYF